MTSMNIGRLRLFQLRERTEAVEEAMIDERARFAALDRKGPTAAVNSFNLFQSPTAIADRMAAMLGPLEGLRCLEPSAGLGRLYRACRGGDWVLVEQAPQCCEHLFGLGVRLIQGDFLACDADRLGGLFDRVIMNPPFRLGLDCRHIEHAFSLLRPSGLLVGLCYDGARQNKRLRPLVDTWEVLPPGSFRSEGTGAGVVLLTWRKPE